VSESKELTGLILLIMSECCCGTASVLRVIFLRIPASVFLNNVGRTRSINDGQTCIDLDGLYLYYIITS
jgi:hypothetical protein